MSATVRPELGAGCTTSPPIAAAVELAGALLVELELGADLELGAVCTTTPPIAAAAKLAGVVRRDVSRVSG